MARRYSLIVFDWDGTLMDSEAKIVATMQAAIADTGLPVRDDGDIREIIGLGLAEALHALFPQADIHEQRKLADRYRYHFLAGDKTPSPLFEGVEALLAQLREEGYWLGVATGKGRRGLDRVLELHGLHRVFHATRTADETRSKPHPQMLEEIMAELCCSGHETLMVGDTEYDMRMAQNAGAHALGVGYGVHAGQRLLDCGARGCLNDIRDLLHWLAAHPGNV